MLHVYLEPGLVTQVAEATFQLDPARLTVVAMSGNTESHASFVLNLSLIMG